MWPVGFPFPESFHCVLKCSTNMKHMFHLRPARSVLVLFVKAQLEKISFLETQLYETWQAKSIFPSGQPKKIKRSVPLVFRVTWIMILQLPHLRKRSFSKMGNSFLPNIFSYANGMHKILFEIFLFRNACSFSVWMSPLVRFDFFPYAMGHDYILNICSKILLASFFHILARANHNTNIQQ